MKKRERWMKAEDCFQDIREEEQTGENILVEFMHRRSQIIISLTKSESQKKRATNSKPKNSMSDKKVLSTAGFLR